MGPSRRVASRAWLRARDFARVASRAWLRASRGLARGFARVASRAWLRARGFARAASRARLRAGGFRARGFARARLRARGFARMASRAGFARLRALRVCLRPTPERTIVGPCGAGLLVVDAFQAGSGWLSCFLSFSFVSCNVLMKEAQVVLVLFRRELVVVHNEGHDTL